MTRRKRDTVEEILGKRKRLGRKGGAFAMADDRSFSIVVAIIQAKRLPVKGNRWNQIVKHQILQYAPVGLVACLEGYFRAAIRDLIDAGPPYRDRIGRLEDLRLSVPTVLRMQDAKVSIGELVAHLLPLASVDDINRHMSILLDDDYFALIKAIDTPRTLNPKAFADARGHSWEHLTALFETRHIICHEIKGVRAVTFKRALEYWRATRFLMDADDQLRMVRTATAKTPRAT